MNRKNTFEHKMVQGIVFTILAFILLLFLTGIVNSCAIHRKVTDMVTVCTDSIKARNSTIEECESTHKARTSTIGKQSLEDIKEFALECHSLLDSNALTFLVTLIVALLAALLLNRIEKIENLVIKNQELVHRNEEIKQETTDFISRSVMYNIFLVYIESIYNLAIMIDNLTEIICLQTHVNFEKIGILCSRISISTNKLDEILDNKEITSMSEKEKQILFTYIDDTLGLLESAKNRIVKKNKDTEKKSLIYKVISERYNGITDLKLRLE